MPAWVQAPSRSLCVEQCGARCCKAPGSVLLGYTELRRIYAWSRPHPLVAWEQPGDRWLVNFSENGGQCPMLNERNECRIYASRPLACHRFPEQPWPGCLVWPASKEVTA